MTISTIDQSTKLPPFPFNLPIDCSLKYFEPKLSNHSLSSLALSSKAGRDFRYIVLSTLPNKLGSILLQACSDPKGWERFKEGMLKIHTWLKCDGPFIFNLHDIDLRSHPNDQLVQAESIRQIQSACDKHLFQLQQVSSATRSLQIFKPKNLPNTVKELKLDGPFACSIEEIPVAFPQLRKLTLVGNGQGYQNIDENFKPCNGLEELIIDWSVAWKFWTQIPSLSPNLKRLTFEENSSTFLLPYDLALPKLEELTIPYSNNTSQFMVNLKENTPNLKELTLYFNSPSVGLDTLDGFEALPNTITKLCFKRPNTHIGVEYQELCMQEILEVASRCCPHLQNLTILNFPENSVQALISRHMTFKSENQHQGKKNYNTFEIVTK